MEQQANEPLPTNERKTQEDAESTVASDQESGLCTTKKPHEEYQPKNTGVDEAGLEQKSVVDKKESLPSLKAEVRHFNQSCSAQSGGTVFTPSIIGSDVGNMITNYYYFADPGSVVSSKEKLNHDAFQQHKNEKITECQKKLRATLKWKFSQLTTEVKRMPLNQIYTELYITKGDSGEVNKEHEVRCIDTESRILVTEEESVHCSHLFVPPQGQELDIRTVFTKGVAGIGKTVSINKFTLDWAEERENTNLDFVFPLSFKELHLIKKNPLSLVELLDVLFPDTKDSGIFTMCKHKMLFILDGLNESQLPLDFKESEIVTEVTQQTTIAVLLTNIIRGRLLPSAFVWITSRPDTSNQIPLECIDLVTMVRGFNNPQKEEFIKKQIRNQSLADKAITHVKSCKTLNIMCHLPFFCHMVASVLEKKLAPTDGKDTPKTLTPMYIYFLSFYVKKMEKRLPVRKESNTDCVRTELISLGKLAFKELEKGNLIFNEDDLIQNGIKVSEPSVLSGIYTKIFSEELILCPKEEFCFVHLSVHEFFAALYVYLTFNIDNENVLVKKPLSRDSSELILYKEAVEKALQCENGHFDIFLRFLLGLSLESNQALLKHLMTSNRTNPKTRDEIIKHIKEKIKKCPSPDRRTNLFHCLHELDDHSLVEEIQSSGSPNTAELSPEEEPSESKLSN